MLPFPLRIPPVAGACLLCLSTVAFAQAPSQPQTPQQHPSADFHRLAKAVDHGDFEPHRPAPFQWLADGEQYTLLEPTSAPGKGSDLVAYDTLSGNRSVLVPAADLKPKDAPSSLTMDSYTWSADHKQLLLFANTQRVWRRNTRGDFWVLTLATHQLIKLGGPAAAPASLMFAKFSPDGHTVAYVRENNLYAEDLATHTVRPLTTDGSYERINGTSDWVNEEELDIRDAFRWSPDSQSIAFWQFDQTGVQDWTLIDDTSAPTPQIRRYRYPQAGTTNAAVRIGVLSVADPSQVTFLKLPGDPRQNYVPRMDWVPNRNQIAVETLNRLQNDDRIFLADPKTGDRKLLVEDTDKAYVDTIGFHAQGVDTDFSWINSQGHADANAALLWFSERDGWRHAYVVPLAGGKPHLITNFRGDVITPIAVNEKRSSFYFTASPDDPVRSYLYRAPLDGSRAPERLTVPSETGSHQFRSPAPNGQFAVESFSTATTAPTYSLVQLSNAKRLRTLAANPDLTTKLKQLDTTTEFSETPIGDGLTLSTMLIKPPHFDPAKKYPVLTYVYGEPASQTVRDAYGYDGSFFDAVAREGYLILSFDNQGTPAPRGHDWRHAGYGSLGVLSTQQQAAAISSFAANHPFVDTSRMAIWGWSGGGTNTLNMMFRDPGLYTTGIAVAPMADQKRYDTIYQERYMGLPSTNAAGYGAGSAINQSQGLTGNLLIIHGSGDDNVHFASTEALVNRLIAEGKAFDFMVYPGRSHGIYEGEGTSRHIYTLIARYLEDHVPAGAR